MVRMSALQPLVIAVEQQSATVFILTERLSLFGIKFSNSVRVERNVNIDKEGIIENRVEATQSKHLFQGVQTFATQPLPTQHACAVLDTFRVAGPLPLSLFALTQARVAHTALLDNLLTALHVGPTPPQ